MGEWFHAVCHTCRKQYQPPLLKARELEINADCREWLGVFLVQHAGHEVELCGDEWTYTRRPYTERPIADYAAAELDEPECGWHFPSNKAKGVRP